MTYSSKLKIGDVSANGQVTIVDEDRLCYLVKSVSKGATGLRTISKALLQEFVSYIEQHPEVPTNEVRFKISGQSEIDKYEYGYGATIGTMAKMVLSQEKIIREEDETSISIIHDSFKGHLPYLTALRTKPFMLLAGISGTGKSRIVREMAKACWKVGDPEYGKNHPKNFCMVQVKPNWHDSSELIGYITRISGTPEYVPGDFVKFIAKAWYDEEHPYFLCLDEMNLAPVEQYFAEYLSVIESRRKENGKPKNRIATDPILKPSYHRKDDGGAEPDEWYVNLVDNLLTKCPNERLSALRQQFLNEGISIPQNLFVVGTVNMDETTFSFSRKVLDRAMTIEMNEVDLHGGLEKDTENEIGYIGNSIIGDAAEGKDVYEDNKELCDQVLEYLEQVNAILKETPFKIAYRTRNEFLMYAVNRQVLAPDSQLWQSLDEMTSMKILSRIEGDTDRTKSALEGLQKLVKEQIEDHIPPAEEGKPQPKSISAAKITEMLNKLKGPGFTSYWT